MLLHQDKANVPMKQVYQLSEELRNDPEQIALTQALTLNSSKPFLGLKGTQGLFGSPEWWSSIEQRKMPLLFISGVIRRVYIAGQDGGDESNGIELLLENGSVRDVGIYVNDKADIALFRVGCRVELVYALDELKKQPAQDGGVNYSKIALEMAVSLQPVGLPSALPRPLVRQAKTHR
ncbi:hypothetical protein [Pseudoduganella namucuonensis]|uniref:Uncharacterized protein n=1 Tax=Pseudoduganella namucuonensis TaxID=1035707 RepID=A0A1I7M8B5_9BURK|nr:hypothetical protein [Pseudoduganella namucuonensis]SFV18127.1 hypothetical protein SAMN05216552_10992 [Pseudoduganella namucuonensis]